MPGLLAYVVSRCSGGGGYGEWDALRVVGLICGVPENLGLGVL